MLQADARLDLSGAMEPGSWDWGVRAQLGISGLTAKVLGLAKSKFLRTNSVPDCEILQTSVPLCQLEKI